MFICHRINTIKELIKIPKEYGVELDLRDNLNGDIYIHHDPFVIGELFEDYLKQYYHKFIILNIKSEGIEYKVLELIKKYNIKDYFFLDCSFPMIYKLLKIGENNIAIRFSELENVNLDLKVKWIWVDCFSNLPINKENYKIFKDNNYKLCLVSPELQGQEDKIIKYKEYLKKENIIFDAICTKIYNINKYI
jgi:hypothetical protein